MATIEKTNITVGVTIHTPVEKVWMYWTDPKHIVHWNNASDDWHTTKAENDLRAGGKFLSRMEARDGSMGFDFTGKYNKIEPHKLIESTLDDGREVKVSFVSDGDETTITEIFEAEQENTIELQQAGWQSILDNFKNYAETTNNMESLHFELSINASAEKVYNTLLDKTHYKEWTSAFNPTSYYKGTWEKGSKILFLGTDPDGNTGGMVSRIKENIPNKFVSIEHLGIIKDGEELTTGDDAESWAGARENYSFTQKGNTTLFAVDTDSNQEFKAYFLETWPLALNKLKEICEQ